MTPFWGTIKLIVPRLGSGTSFAALSVWRRSGPSDIAAMQMTEFSELEAIYRIAYSGAKARAKKNGWRILSDAEFLQVVRRSKGCCELTGRAFDNTAYTVPWRGKRPFQSYPWRPSLDRLDNLQGYEIENVRLVCVEVNAALSYLPDEVFAEMCRAFVAKHGLQ